MGKGPLLGDWSDHTEKSWEKAKQYLGRLGRDQVVVDDEGYESEIKAAAVDQTGDKIAWVETREKETKPGFWDVTHTLLSSRKNQIIARWELPSYNPFFGCEIGVLEWFGNEIGVVYCEKHQTITAVFDTGGRGRRRLLAIGEDWKCDSDVVYFVSKEPGLIESCKLPQLQQGVPIATGLNPSERLFVPKVEIPTSDFVGQVAHRLFGETPPQPISDTLIGSAAYRFWDHWPTPVKSYGFPKRWNSPFWIPFHWYEVMDKSSRTEFIHFLKVIASKSFVEHLATDFAINMAAEQTCRSAELWLDACRSKSVPKDQRCYFWVEWSQSKFKKDLGVFPDGFREVYQLLSRHRRKIVSRFLGRIFGRK